MKKKIIVTDNLIAPKNERGSNIQEVESIIFDSDKTIVGVMGQLLKYLITDPDTPLIVKFVDGETILKKSLYVSTADFENAIDLES